MKDQLKQELLKKIKLGIKPSELKKNQALIDEGYESEIDSHQSSVKNQGKDKVKQLQDQVKFESQKAQNYLTNLQRTMAELDQAQQEIAQLQSQPIRLSQETEQAIMEANQKIRELIKTNEDLRSKNTALNQTISNLKEQAKITENTKQEETSTTFTCASCSRIFDRDLIRLVKKSGKKICRHCTLKMLARANQITGLKIVLKKKQAEANPQVKTFLCQTCQQTQPGEPHQVHLTNYQDQGIAPQALTSICSACLESKVVLANFYCPRTSEGKDTWDPKEEQFDCWCPNERSNT